MEQNLYQTWLQRKLDQSPFELIRAVTVTKTWRKSTGGRILFGQLTLEATPSETFSYHEEATWPTDYPYFNGCVIDGILDALLIDLGHTPGNTCFVLKAVEWHEEYSVPRAYHEAAREAVAEIFAENEKHRIGYPFDCKSSK